MEAGRGRKAVEKGEGLGKRSCINKRKSTSNGGLKGGEKNLGPWLCCRRGSKFETLNGGELSLKRNRKKALTFRLHQTGTGGKATRLSVMRGEGANVNDGFWKKRCLISCRCSREEKVDLRRPVAGGHHGGARAEKGSGPWNGEGEQRSLENSKRKRNFPEGKFGGVLTCRKGGGGSTSRPRVTDQAEKKGNFLKSPETEGRRAVKECSERGFAPPREASAHQNLP